MTKVKTTQQKKTKLRKECDRLWTQIYLKPKCEVCGKTGVLQGHHYFYKGSYSFLRYEPENHITLCQGCHFVLHHQDPKKIEMRIIEKKGKKWYNSLSRKANTRPKQSFQTLAYFLEEKEKLKVASIRQ